MLLDVIFFILALVLWLEYLLTKNTTNLHVAYLFVHHHQVAHVDSVRFGLVETGAEI